MKFQHKVALVTGGNSGIGRATALLLAREGAAVVVAARDEARNADVVGEVLAHPQGAAGSGTPAPERPGPPPPRTTPSAGPDAEAREGESPNREGPPSPTGPQAPGGEGEGGPRAVAVSTDVTSDASCRAAVERAMEVYGRLDILVNNAGVILRDRSVAETTPEEWDLTFDVNVKGTYLMSRAALPHLPEGGAIVNNASYLGLVGGRGVAAYAAAKGAVVNLTRAMALDHAPRGIRVNCVAPGSVETPMLRKEWEDMGGEAAVRHLFRDKHPLGRIARPEEIARAILFLASDDAAFLTGACVPVDGGLTAG